jgi:hypothetical protein
VISHTINALEAEIADLVAQVAPQLLAERGCGPLTAAKLVGEIAGAGRFATDAKLARAAGIAPIPASSGRTNRHRLDRCGNRQINAAIHRMAVTRARCDPQTRDYIARKKAEGKTNRDAIRCLKRHLTRRVWQLLRAPRPVHSITPTINLLTLMSGRDPSRPAASRLQTGLPGTRRLPHVGGSLTPRLEAGTRVVRDLDHRRGADRRKTIYIPDHGDWVTCRGGLGDRGIERASCVDQRSARRDQGAAGEAGRDQRPTRAHRRAHRRRAR